MHKRSKIIISSFLTLGLVGSVVAYNKYEEHDFYVKKRVVRSLDLNHQQSKKLDQLVETAIGSTQLFQRSNFINISEILVLLDEERLDQEKVMGMIQERLSMVEQHAQVLIASTANFTDSLDTEQRTTLKEMASNRVGKHERHWHGHD